MTYSLFIDTFRKNLAMSFSTTFIFNPRREGIAFVCPSVRYTFLSAPYPLNPLMNMFIKLHLNVPLSETVCITHDSASQTQGQGHTSKSRDFPFNVVSAPYVLNLMFLSVIRCAKTMTQQRRFKVKVIGFTFHCRVRSIFPSKSK